MATLRKLRETELIGGTSNEDLYPITSALGVYTKDNERLQDYIDELGNLYSFAGIVGPGDAPLGNRLLNEYYLAIDSGVYVNFDSYEVLDNEICIFMHNTKSGWKIYSFLLGSGGGGEGYVLPIASENRLGGIKTGFTQKNKCYPVQVDAEGNAYVCVPWEGGGGGEEPGDIPVAGVSIQNGSAVSIEVGESIPLFAEVTPSNATNQNVTWKSSSPSIVTVDADTGRITGISAGTATVAVTTEDGGFTDTCTVTVKAQSEPVYSYFGVVAEDFVISEQNIKDSTEALTLSSRSYTGTVAMDYQKTLYAYPKSYGELESIKDANGFEYLLSYTREEISMNGEDYYVYILTDAATIPMFKQIYS